MASGDRAGGDRVPGRRHDAPRGGGASRSPCPAAAFAVLTEADGSQTEAAAGREALREALAEGALGVHAPDAPRDIAALCGAGATASRWRSPPSAGARSARTSPCPSTGWPRRSRHASRSARATAWRRSAGATPATATCTRRSCSTAATEADLERAEQAAHELFELAVALGGSISGEHGLGVVKSGQLRRQWDAARRGAAPGDQARVRPEGPAQPGQEAGIASRRMARPSASGAGGAPGPAHGLEHHGHGDRAGVDASSLLRSPV